MVKSTGNASDNLSPQTIEAIMQALDDFGDSLREDHRPFLGSESSRTGLMFSNWEDLVKDLRKPQTCMFDGCRAKSIAMSHTLQRAGPLEFIAEDDHVLTPAFAPNKDGFYMRRAGINEASTFPGFCEKHESIFADFERAKDIRDDRDVTLQVFRTICRELTVKRIQLNGAQKWLEQHDALVSRGGVEFLIDRLGCEYVGSPDNRIQSVKTEGLSKAQLEIKNSIAELEDVVRRLEDAFLPASYAEIGGQHDALAHVSMTIGDTVPVCMAGVANFHVNDHGDERSVGVILNVLPFPGKSVLIASVLAKDKEGLYAYVHSSLDRMNGALIMLETWMVYGPDHWFIRPSEWSCLPAERQHSILHSMTWDELDIGNTFPLSILDSVRRRTLETPEAKAEPQRVFQLEADKLRDREA